MQIILSFLPILSLLCFLLILKLPAMKASAISFLIALLIFVLKYQSGIIGLAISMSKGFSLAIFVILIIWGAMFLYNLVHETGALDVINTNIEKTFTDRFLQFILLSWVFSAFLQGIAGFGVPVIIVTPILISLGFDPVVSVAAVLVGHSWAISFGSMGSSIYAINMVTNAPPDQIIIYMALFGSLGLVFTGFIVCFIYGGAKHLIKGAPYVIVLSITMGAMLFLMAKLEMYSVTGLLTGLTGLITCFIINRFQRKKEKAIKLYKAQLTLFHAVLPYLLIIIFSIAFYIINPKVSLGFDFPAYTTGLGHHIKEETDYVTFNLLKYPFVIIMLSSMLSMIVFYRKKVLNRKKIKSIISQTAKKCIPTSITIVFLLNMAVIMMDSGMINEIAEFLASVTGYCYPLVAPFIGLLGAFVTGSNTNSNIIFGSLQETAANSIGINVAVICAVQSIGASIGNSIGPTTVSLGATAAQIQGNESKIYRKTLIPILITVSILGFVNMLIVNLQQ